MRISSLAGSMATEGPRSSRPILVMLWSTANFPESTPRSSAKLGGQLAASGGSSIVAKATGSTSTAAPSLNPLPKASSTASSSGRPSRFTPPMEVMVQPTSRWGCPGLSSMRSTRMPQQVGVSSTPAPCSGWTRTLGVLDFPLPAPFGAGAASAASWAAGAAPQSLLLGASGAACHSSAPAEGSGSASSRTRPAYLGPVDCANADQLLPLAFFFAPAGASVSSAGGGFGGAA
mmetsp:Transcript_4086/g.11366  ORF Transcript_4086/g.11366 Transcript_4086/m.11366 type:complete len:232 (-) Transcript_4086:610-1305(-)